jgi:hypothetical protein
MVVVFCGLVTIDQGDSKRIVHLDGGVTRSFVATWARSSSCVTVTIREINGPLIRSIEEEFWNVLSQ